MLEHTLAIIKPDGFDWSKEIRERYEKAGLKVLIERHVELTGEQAREFYAEHRGKFFFKGLTLAMSSGPSVILILQGEDAVARVRALNGATDPSKAEPGTIRHDFRSAGGPFNTVHGSDSVGAAKREMKLSNKWKGF